MNARASQPLGNTWPSLGTGAMMISAQLQAEVAWRSSAWRWFVCGPAGSPWLVCLLTAMLWNGFTTAEAQARKTPPGGGRRVALVVGVSDYNDKSLRDLDYTSRDAEHLAGLLRVAGFD